MAYPSILNATKRIEAILESNVNLDGGSGKEIQRLLYELRSISKLLDDAERRSVADKNVNMWLKRLQDTVYEMEDVLDEREMEMMEPQSNDLLVSRRPIHKVCPSFLSYSNKQVPHPQIPTKILDLMKQVNEIFMEKDRFNLIHGSWTRILELKSSASMKLYGRDEDRYFLVSKLVMEESGGVRIWCIVGMCGIGKTALARIVYDDDKVEELFELRIWIDVCGEISKGIIKWVEEERCPCSNELDVALECLRDCISGKKFLLVLDDVRTVHSTDWELVKQFLVGCGAADSKILVTTRIEDMTGSTNTEMYRLKVLSIHESLDIIYNTAQLLRPGSRWPHQYDLEAANKLSTKCKGLPLVATLFGILLGLDKLRVENGVVRMNRRFGEDVVDEEIWQLGEVEEVVSHCLSFIYVELPPKLKYCFSYCAVFPKDYAIDVERVIEYWIIQGYVGPNIESGRDLARLDGQNCVDTLIRISLFQGLEKSEDGQIKRFKMRDMVHDFAQSIRMNGRVEAGGTGKAILQVCDPPLDSIVQEYRTLFNPPITHLSSRPLILKLRILSLRGSNFPFMPPVIKYSIHLRWLELSGIILSQEDIKSVCKLYKLQFLRLSSCNLKEIPSEIGNLSDLRNLDLSFNYFLKGLPESICCLVELRALNLDCCHSFSKLPQGIHKLTKLEHLHYKDAHFLFKLPQGLGSLTSLRTLTKFHGGRHLNELKLLRNLDSLSGSLELHIRLTDDLLEDAREAELEDKHRIRYLKITFYDYMDGKDDYMDDKDWFPRREIIDALKPHEGLRELEIRDSNGSTIPSWIISPYNQLKSLVLSCFNHLESLPPLGKLPHLEELRFDQMFGLQYVGPEFLGITREAVSEIEESEVLSSSSSSPAAAYNHNVIGFAKLKKLIFNDCPNWEEWEDISTQEEKQLMPCLTMLRIKSCEGLRELPLRLLRKVPSLRVLDISGSTKLQQHYHDKASKSISQNPCFRILL